MQANSVAAVQNDSIEWRQTTSKHGEQCPIRPFHSRRQIAFKYANLNDASATAQYDRRLRASGEQRHHENRQSDTRTTTASAHFASPASVAKSSHWPLWSFAPPRGCERSRRVKPTLQTLYVLFFIEVGFCGTRVRIYSPKSAVATLVESECQCSVGILKRRGPTCKQALSLLLDSSGNFSNSAGACRALRKALTERIRLQLPRMRYVSNGDVRKIFCNNAASMSRFRKLKKVWSVRYSFGSCT